MKLCVGVLAAMSAVAHAEPYPRDLVARPLVLPDGLLEAELGGTVEYGGDTTPGNLDAHVAYGFHAFELGVGTSIQVLDTPPVDGRVRALSLDAFRTFIPQLAGGMVVDVADGFRVHVGVRYKQLVAARVAVIASAYGGYRMLQEADPMTMKDVTVQGTIVGGHAGAELQAHPLVGVALTVAGEYTGYDSDLREAEDFVDASAAAVISAAPSIDVSVGYTHHLRELESGLVFASVVVRLGL